MANEPRLSEAVETYQDLGFEVHLEPLPKASERDPECAGCGGPEGGEECRICFEGFEDQYKIIFTRPAKGHPDAEGDLF